MVVVRPGELIALDSNFLVAMRKPGSVADDLVERWLRLGCVFEISTIAWSEYLCGPVRADDVALSRKLISQIEVFTEADAELAAELFNYSGRRSRTHADSMIAAQAIRRGAILATLNARDFRPFERRALRVASS